MANNQCPRCGTGALQSWSELSDEDRMVVERLPGSANYSIEERKARHQWCPRCWFEDTGRTPTLV